MIKVALILYEFQKRNPNSEELTSCLGPSQSNDGHVSLHTPFSPFSFLMQGCRKVRKWEGVNNNPRTLKDNFLLIFLQGSRGGGTFEPPPLQDQVGIFEPP